MKKNNISSNARKAFENFKEELADEMGLDKKNPLNKSTAKIIDKAKELYSNLGRS